MWSCPSETLCLLFHERKRYKVIIKLVLLSSHAYMHNFDSFTSAMDDNFEIFDCFEPNRVADPCDLDYPLSYNLMERQ